MRASLAYRSDEALSLRAAMANGMQALWRRHQYGSGPYYIQVSGLVGHHWEPELRMRVTYLWTPRGVITTLSGNLPDQSALLGTLNRLAMWGYLILEVRYEIACETLSGLIGIRPPF